MNKLIKAFVNFFEDPDRDIKEFLQTEYKEGWYWAYTYYKERGTFPSSLSIRV